MKKKRNYHYLKNLKDEFKQVSEEYDIPLDDLKEMFDELFLQLRKWIVSPKMPKIILHSFGIFEPSINKIELLIWRRIKKLRELPDTEENKKKRETLKKKIRYAWAIKQRHIAEKRGIRTFQCWKELDADLTGYEECHRPTEQNCHRCKSEEISQDT